MQAYKKTFEDLKSEMSKVIVGQEETIEQVLVALLCDSHALLEGYPGLAKTMMVRTIARLMDLKFSRVQNTPDLMPSDIIGTYVIEETGGKREFRFHPGPIFANIVLADEINRATPKTQSALLEAMQEKQVTVGNSTFKLDAPFFVLATMNPIEQEGSLALDQNVFINGELKTGKELLDHAKGDPLLEDKQGKKMYDIGAWTLSLNTDGKLEKKSCMLYTLPYKDEMAIITTKTGKKLKVTKNHPFLVNDRGIITWKKADELTKQDFLVNPARIDTYEYRFMAHEDAVALMKQKKLNTEIPFDEDFAFWTAFLLSDGYIGEKCIEAVQKNYPEALDRFIEVSKKYGLNPSVNERGGCRYARIYSKPLIEYLGIRFGIKGGKDKEIPSSFLSLTPKMNREFIRTFISLESSLRDNRIVFTQKSANNMSLISYMLLREGILSWIRHDGRIHRMKIQGKELITFVKKIGWVSSKKLEGMDLSRTIKSSFRSVPVERKAILELVSLLGMNSFHTLKGRKSITSRNWYCSYKGIKEGEIVMSVDSLKEFAEDVKAEISLRETSEFASLLDNEPRRFAAGIGTPMTKICNELKLPRSQVMNLYENKTPKYGQQIKQMLKIKHTACIEKAKSLLRYCEVLLSEDVYYDKIKSIEYTRPEGMAFGLTVPELQNYVAGFGACGINHNTYPLPEAQADRFLLKIKVTYPTFQEEMEIVNRYGAELKDRRVKLVLDKTQLTALQDLTRQVPIASDLKERIIKIVTKTRNFDLFAYGASPRATVGLMLAAKARALINDRNHVSTEDIVKMAYPVLRHRIILNFEAERKGMTVDDAITQLLEKTK